jgi:hypothetical protein
MADGSYELKTRAEDFYDFVHEQTLQQFQDLKIREIEKNQSANNILNNSPNLTQTRIDLLKFSGIMTSDEDKMLLKDMEANGFNFNDTAQKEITERLSNWIKS